MTNPAKAITRLNPKGIDSTRSFIPGSWPELTTEMILDACAGLKDKYYIALLIKWQDPGYRITYMSELLLNEISAVVVREGWKYEKGFLLALCALAVADLGYPGKMTDALRAEFLGRHAANFSARYKKRYEFIYSTLNDLTNVAYQHVSKRLNA